MWLCLLASTPYSSSTAWSLPSSLSFYHLLYPYETVYPQKPCSLKTVHLHMLFPWPGISFFFFFSHHFYMQVSPGKTTQGELITPPLILLAPSHDHCTQCNWSLLITADLNCMVFECYQAFGTSVTHMNFLIFAEAPVSMLGSMFLESS